jgi:uncharacterized protein YuzE
MLAGVRSNSLSPLKIKYFADTDTLYVEFGAAAIADTRDLDEDTLLDLNAEGRICGITLEHGSLRTDIPQFSYELNAA